VNYSTDWSHIARGPEDPILGITIAYNKDKSPKKINLGVGAYRDDNGKPYILNCVKRATDRIISDPQENHEYLPIVGDAKFNNAAAQLLLGDNAPTIKEKKYTTIQALSGTGALRVITEFLGRFYKDGKTVFMPNPTWANHIPITKDSGLLVGTYRYYNNKTNSLDWQGLKEDLKNAPNRSIILLHACAHNPTGQDPNQEQWKELVPIFQEKGHFPFFDSAYQGFASGDPDKDAWAIRHFVEQGLTPAIAQSFAKNFGLYGQRAGTVTFVTRNPTEAVNIESQLKILVRPMYSNPPKWGSRLVSEILNDRELRQEWYGEVKLMADRIISMRTALVNGLAAAGSTRDWKHITDQIGMFCYSGLTPEQVDRLANEFHIYLTRNGRISMAGVTSSNVDYLASSMHKVTSS